MVNLHWFFCLKLGVVLVFCQNETALSLSLEGPEHTGIPLPILTQVASRGTLYIRIKMIILAGHAGKAYTVLKPSIMVVVINAQAFCAVSQCSAVVAGELM